MLLLLRTCASARVAAPWSRRVLRRTRTGRTGGGLCLHASAIRSALRDDSSAFSTGIRTLPLALSTQP